MILPDLGRISMFACWDWVFEFQTQGSVPKRQRIDLTHFLTFSLQLLFPHLFLADIEILQLSFFYLQLWHWKVFPCERISAPDAAGVKNPSGNKLVTAAQPKIVILPLLVKDKHVKTQDICIWSRAKLSIIAQWVKQANHEWEPERARDSQRELKIARES